MFKSCLHYANYSPFWITIILAYCDPGCAPVLTSWETSALQSLPLQTPV